jgi:hypothetical protein
MASGHTMALRKRVEGGPHSSYDNLSDLRTRSESRRFRQNFWLVISLGGLAGLLSVFAMLLSN